MRKSIHGRDIFFKLIGSFISPKEKDMLAKRIAIMYLLKRQMPANMVCSILKVSKATVAKFTLLLEQDTSPLSTILEKLIKKRVIVNLLETVSVGSIVQPGTIGVNWLLAWKRKIKREKYQKRGCSSVSF